MMPLILADVGEEMVIHKVGGSPEMRKHLEDMGFVPGSMTSVVSSLNGNLIVKIKDSRVGLSVEMARRIMVQGE